MACAVPAGSRPEDGQGWRDLARAVAAVLAGGQPMFTHASGRRPRRSGGGLHAAGRRPPPPQVPPPPVPPQDAPADGAAAPPGQSAARDTARTGGTPPSFTPNGAARVDPEHADSWELVVAAQGGDGAAFGQLYERYGDAVYRYIYYRVGDAPLAEDFTSETFLRALRSIRRLNYQGRDVGAWFTTIARNIVFDHAKSARHRLEVVTDTTPEPATPASGTESTVLARLNSERLVDAVNQLSIDQRECVVLRFLQGMSVSETAEVMGKKDGAIKALQHRAVRRLADIFSAEPA